MLTRLAAGVLLLVLATGCITQPVDEAALEQELGAGAAPIAKAEAAQTARKVKAATRRARQAAKGRKAAGADARTRGRKGRAAGAGAGAVTGGGAAPATDDAAPATGDRPPARGTAAAPVRQPRSGSGVGTGGGGRASGGTATPSARIYTLAEVVDPQGDPSGDPPAYADVRQVLVESDGERVRVTVAFAGRIPEALEDGEVQGVGIDLYRSDDAESDYQLFADGGSDGWTAFLHTPQGIATYPGSYRLGGKVMIFEVPWSALGGRRSARMGMFVDWSKERTVLNKVGNDRAPDKGTVQLNPA